MAITRFRWKPLLCATVTINGHKIANAYCNATVNFFLFWESCHNDYDVKAAYTKDGKHCIVIMRYWKERPHFERISSDNSSLSRQCLQQWSMKSMTKYQYSFFIACRPCFPVWISRPRLENASSPQSWHNDRRRCTYISYSHWKILQAAC